MNHFRIEIKWTFSREKMPQWCTSFRNRHFTGPPEFALPSIPFDLSGSDRHS